MIISLFLPFLVGFFLGFAQNLTRLYLMNSFSYRSILLLVLTLFFYLVAGSQWVQILKSDMSLTSSYSIVVLGVFVGIVLTNSFLAFGKHPFTIYDGLGILLIFAGCSLVRR